AFHYAWRLPLRDFFFSSRRRHTRWPRDWSSDVCSSDLNFYVSFLAALDIDRNPEKYFGALQKQTEARFQEVQVPAYVPMATLERALKIDADKLRALNPALLRSVWDGQQRVPKAYHLRLPLDGSGWTRELLAQRLSPAEMFAGQSSP